MDKLFEKVLSFIILSSFLGLSYIIFNINEYEYKSKSKELQKGMSIETFKIPEWLKEHSRCDEFSILKQKKYTITKCLIGNQTTYFKDDTDQKSIDLEYLYEYNNKTNLINIFVTQTDFSDSNRKDLSTKITEDFAHFLGVSFKEKEFKEDKKINSFTIIKKNTENKSSFNLIKK